MLLMMSLLSKMSTNHTGMLCEQQIIFLLTEGVPSAEIQQRFAAVFSDDCSSHVYVFEWCTHFHDGHQSVSDDVHTGTLCTAVTTENTKRAE